MLPNFFLATVFLDMAFTYDLHFGVCCTMRAVLTWLALFTDKNKRRVKPFAIP